LHIASLKWRGGQITHHVQIGFQPFPDADLMSTQDVSLPFPSFFFKVVVDASQ
jgi:hypothetical protein